MPPRRTGTRVASEAGTGVPSERQKTLLGREKGRTECLPPPSSATAPRRTRQKGGTSQGCSLERVVRPAPTERMARTLDVDPGGGMMGAAAGKGRTKEQACPMERRAEERTETCSTVEEREPACPRRTPTRKTQGLTPPSSATEAGEEGRGLQKKAERQPLFAGARG